MRRIIISGLILGCVLIVMASISSAGQVPFALRPLLKMMEVVSVQNGSELNHTGSSQDFHEEIVIRAVLNTPSFNYMVKRMLPAWGKVLLVKRVINTSFFFPIMVLLLFFVFYQSSRTASESDPHIEYDYSSGVIYTPLEEFISWHKTLM